MIVGVADTHAALWYLFADTRLSPVAKQFIDDAVKMYHQIAVSAVSLAEVVYLVEKGRLPSAAYVELTQCLDDPPACVHGGSVYDRHRKLHETGIARQCSRYAGPHDRGDRGLFRSSNPQPRSAYSDSEPEDNLVIAII